MNNDEIPNPLSVLAAAAATMHEFYLAYVAAGFMPDQAMYLIGQILAATFRNQQL